MVVRITIKCGTRLQSRSGKFATVTSIGRGKNAGYVYFVFDDGLHKSMHAEILTEWYTIHND